MRKVTFRVERSGDRKYVCARNLLRKALERNCHYFRRFGFNIELKQYQSQYFVCDIFLLTLAAKTLNKLE